MDKPQTPEISPENKMTPMLVQYRAIKSRHPDSILLYRMGDFYEMFFDDALKAAPVLEVQLTARDKNAANPIPMCGVPYHSITSYIQKLVSRGFKVAICEQMEDAATVKGLVRRDVTRVITPALVPDPELVSDDVCNILLCVFEKQDGKLETAALDLLKSQVKVGVVDAETLVEVASNLAPKEILIAPSLVDAPWMQDLKKMFSSLLVTVREDFFSETAGFATLVALGRYLEETQKTDQLPHLSNPAPLFESECLKLDHTTLQSLEVLKSASPLSDTTSLFHILDFTVTPMGRRTLREWLAEPLNNKEKIHARLSCVSELLQKSETAAALKDHLSQIRDLERLTTKTLLGLAMPRDLVAIREILKAIPPVKMLLAALEAPALREFGDRLEALESLTQTLDEALVDLPPATLRDGGILKDTYHPQIAEYRSLSQDAKSTIAGIETREKERTGIASLKVKYSKVFGYTIEITKSQLKNKIPPEYIRKQTIAGGERFITEELKSFEEKVVTAEQKLKSLEESLFIQLRTQVAHASAPLLNNARALAEIDVLNGFARAARERGYTCPHVHAGWDLTIEDGRHPVVETLMPSGQFIPNSIAFANDECRTWLITGPNMGGKSTIMRQVALIVLMAQAGSFVPARVAKIPLVDAIFTRIGSSDDLAHGRSTFMVEMTEVARILTKATARSLILIDEIGRGTSTYDGLSLAWSILEFMHTQLKAKTLFATHFHELTEIEKKLPGLRNASVLVEKWKGEIVFLHRLAAGVCNRSYGIEVAKLAGLPAPVLTRAKQIVTGLEAHSQKGLRARNRALEIHDNQMVFFEEFGPSEIGPQ